MPYFITDKNADCSGWSVVDDAGEAYGCHTTKQDAIDQAVAISISDDEPFDGERAKDFADSVVARLEAEGERKAMNKNVEKKNKWLDAAWLIKTSIEGVTEEARQLGKTEQRVNVANLEIRDASDGMAFEGYAAIFNSDSEPLPFIERIQPGAFKRSLQSRNEIKMLWNHDAGEPLASLRGGTLKIFEDNIGLRVSAQLANTQRGRDTAELIRSGTIDSMSFGFNVVKDSWNSDGTVRTLEAVRLFEISLVSFPAYQATAGTVSVREQRDIDADKLAESLAQLESGAELGADQAELIKTVVDKLTAQSEEIVEPNNGFDLVKLQQLKLKLLEKGI
jgi:HK97 family phage prohead protease